MFLRPYRSSDKRTLQQLFFDTVHTVNAGDYTSIQLEAWAPQEPRRETWAKLDQQHCFVVEFQKMVVGFASLSDSGSIDFLYVHKHFQGRGIASTLLKQLERLARKKGFPSISVESSITASVFFEKVGFQLTLEDATLFNGAALKVLRMEKKLESPAMKDPKGHLNLVIP